MIENFKVGGLAKYGLDYASLQRRESAPHLLLDHRLRPGRPRTRERAGYDFMIQGMGGIMDLTGEPDGRAAEDGRAPVADIFTGLYGVIGILAALRQRDATGEGATSTWRCSTRRSPCSPTRR